MPLAAAVFGPLAFAAASPWQGLHDGLNAWQAFGFDSNFSFEIQSGNETLFRFPGTSPDLLPKKGSDVTRTIKGAKGDLLANVTSSFIADVLAGKTPGNPASTDEKGVPRVELLAQGGGVTLLHLAELMGTRTTGGDEWQPLRDGLNAWAKLEWDVNFTFNAGRPTKTLFTHTEGSIDMHTRVAGASLSKWPAAMTISGLVADGQLDFEDKVNKHLSWWTTDPTDPRSEITLRHLLTFQSGYVADAEVPCAADPKADYVECARKLYETLKLVAKPGTAFTYLSCHLQLAGAVAVTVSGLNPKQLFEKYLYEPLNMTGTTWGTAPFTNPQFATGIITIGADFEKMMQKMLTYEFLGKKVLDYAERDWSAPPVSPCGDGWFGHYGMGHWYDCLGYAAGQKAGASAALPAMCLREAIQAGPGAFGYFPLIDRHRNYYMQIVLMEDTACRSEVPEYLRAASKPVVDMILAGKAPTNEELLSVGGGVTLAELTDIYNYIPPQCTPAPFPPTPPAQ
eukprot:TRINITY_DN5850_c0_g1_i1.p2 TRINITY_DN5850_c0_g1~~TRINITY_DN5850_c0_g1_i1.p2  ORF type:complete len:529 (+),score=188.33 TRINITY_DN5850_c0_g1_i1:58-1587(+)